MKRLFRLLKRKISCQWGGDSHTYNYEKIYWLESLASSDEVWKIKRGVCSWCNHVNIAIDIYEQLDMKSREGLILLDEKKSGA